jgi:hypothetical protein
LCLMSGLFSWWYSIMRDNELIEREFMQNDTKAKYVYILAHVWLIHNVFWYI